MPDYIITFKQNKPILDLYKRLKKDNVTDEQIDKGYMKTDWVKKKRIPVGPGDHKLEMQEVLDYALEHYERYQLDIKETTGYIVPWSLDDLDPKTDFDEKIRQKIDKAISFFKDEIKKAGYKEGTDRYQELLAVCLFAFALAPTDGDFSRFVISNELKLRAEKLETNEWIAFIEGQGKMLELEKAGLTGVSAFLKKNGGLGATEMKTTCKMQATALQALDLKCGVCLELSSVLYTVFKKAGIETSLIWAKTNKQFKQIINQEDARHVSVMVTLSNKKRIFDLGLGTSDAKKLYDKQLEWWFEVDDIDHLAGYYNNLASVYGNNGKSDLAIEACKKAISINPDYAEAYFNLGTIYTDNKKYDLAIEAFKRAIEIDSSLADAYSNMGVAYEAKGEYDQAIESFHKAINIDPSIIQSYENINTLCSREKKIDLAIDVYNKVVKSKPKHAYAYLYLGICYGNKNEFDPAISALNKAIKIFENAGEKGKTVASAHFYLGVIYGIKGKEDLAVKAYENAIKADPNYFQAYANLGSIYYKRNEIDLAIKAFKNALIVNPNDAISKKNLKIVLARKEELGETTQKAEKDSAHNRPTPTTAKEYCDLGYQYYINNQEKKALDSYKRATTIDPQSQDAWLGLWRCYKSLKDKENTKKACEKYKSLSKSPISCEE